MSRVAIVTGGSRGIGAAISKASRPPVTRSRRQATTVPPPSPRRRASRPTSGTCRTTTPASPASPKVEAISAQSRSWSSNAGITRDGMFHKMTRLRWDAIAAHQPRFAVQHDPSGLGRHARPQVRPRRLHLLDQRSEGSDGSGQLFGRQGRRPPSSRPSPKEGARAGITVNAICRATSPPRWSRRSIDVVRSRSTYIPVNRLPA